MTPYCETEEELKLELTPGHVYWALQRERKMTKREKRVANTGGAMRGTTTRQRRREKGGSVRFSLVYPFILSASPLLFSTRLTRRKVTKR